MGPALHVAALWLLFAGTHVGLATARIRSALVARLGEHGFRAIYTIVAATTFTLLVRGYAARRFDGAAGLALGDVAWLRWPLQAVVVAGVALVFAGLFSYPQSPSAMFAKTVSEPRGVDRITRHPFFAGSALVAVAHVLLATHLTGAVFMTGYAVLSVLGAWHQDRKLLALRGPAYADYLTVTSFVPFAAALSGRGRIAWRELGPGVVAGGVATALTLRAAHDGIFSAGGAWVIGTVLAGGVIAGLQSWRRERRRARAASPAAAA